MTAMSLEEIVAKLLTLCGPTAVFREGNQFFSRCSKCSATAPFEVKTEKLNAPFDDAVVIQPINSEYRLTYLWPSGWYLLMHAERQRPLCEKCVTELRLMWLDIVSRWLESPPRADA